MYHSMLSFFVGQDKIMTVCIPSISQIIFLDRGHTNFIGEELRNYNSGSDAYATQK